LRLFYIRLVVSILFAEEKWLSGTFRLTVYVEEELRGISTQVLEGPTILLETS
jgi:hypothetical protein